jgi:hypothetical protein
MVGDKEKNKAADFAIHLRNLDTVPTKVTGKLIELISTECVLVVKILENSSLVYM